MIARNGWTAAFGSKDRTGVGSVGQTLSTLWEDERGQDLVEYVFIVLLVSLAVVTALQLLGSNLSTKYESVKDPFNQ